MPDFQRLLERRLDTLVEVDQPLVLVSQVQRSGGTLLSQLFDAHPQAHAHPYELKIGYPNKLEWPKLDLADPPERWWEMLSENDVVWLFRLGYSKYSGALMQSLPRSERPETFPFLFSHELQRHLFVNRARTLTAPTSRAVLDCYMSSYFNAWLDNQNLYVQPKRVVTGFTPRLISGDGNVDAFFADYPDGTLVSLVREPRAWLASALRHHGEGYAELDEAIGTWRTSTSAALDAATRYGDRVIVLTYEELVTSTEPAMRRIAARIGIDFHPTLLEPTFNGFAIRADSAFEVPEHGIITTPIARGAELEPSVAARVQDELGGLYEEVAGRSE